LNRFEALLKFHVGGYSYRKAMSGSTFVARLAGTNAAHVATAPNELLQGGDVIDRRIWLDLSHHRANTGDYRALSISGAYGIRQGKTALGKG
jgi:hypothetical protein